jgi:hypothetical protein
MIAAHGGGHGQGFPCSLLPGALSSVCWLFIVTGSLLSLVFRTEDVWQRCNQFIETAEFLIRVSPSHSYNADSAGLGWMGGCKCTLPSGVVLCIVFVTMLPDTVDDSSTSTRCLYFSPSQLCLIKRIRNFKGLSYLNLGYSYSAFF